MSRKTLKEAIEDGSDFHIISGMGNDSCEMIADCYDKGLVPKSVIFCDTGNEMPHTYKFVAFLSLWMMSRGWSKLVILKKYNANGDVINVYDENFKNGRLPPPVYGFKTCSQRFKFDVADKYLAKEHGHMTNGRIKWKGWDKKIVKAIGVNADEDSRINSWLESDCFEQVFPLVDNDIGEDGREDVVKKHGLYRPGKSACFMCPNSTAKEVVYMHENYPWLYRKGIAMEKNVSAHGNDNIDVDRVFVVDKVSGSEVKLPTSRIKKVNKKICLESTLDAMPKKEKKAFGFESDSDQFSLIPKVMPELVVKSVREKTIFVGLGRTVSWEDIVKYYQETGETMAFDFVGAEMCGGAGCGT